jgi:hypothetical protein
MEVQNKLEIKPREVPVRSIENIRAVKRYFHRGTRVVKTWLNEKNPECSFRSNCGFYLGSEFYNHQLEMQRRIKSLNPNSPADQERIDRIRMLRDNPANEQKLLCVGYYDLSLNPDFWGRFLVYQVPLKSEKHGLAVLGSMHVPWHLPYHLLTKHPRVGLYHFPEYLPVGRDRDQPVIEKALKYHVFFNEIERNKGETFDFPVPKLGDGKTLKDLAQILQIPDKDSQFDLGIK